MKTCWPGVLYRFDFAGGLYMSWNYAKLQKELQESRAFVDLVIYEKSQLYCGLFLEVKPEGMKLKKKNGNYVSDHIAEQAAMIDRLNAAGYHACFVIGIHEAVWEIEEYLLHSRAKKKRDIKF